MRGVVVGRHGLDELERMSRAAFSAVPARGLAAPRFSEHATRGAGLLIKAVPERAGHVVELQWRVPSEIQHYRAGPCQFLSHLVG